MNTTNKQSLAGQVWDGLKNPTKLAGLWGIAKSFPAIIFLIALYLIADKYIESREKIDMEKIRKNFIYQSSGGLSSINPEERKVATLLVQMVMSNNEDPYDFIELMYRGEKDSTIKAVYQEIVVANLTESLFNPEEDNRNAAFEKLKGFWINETPLIPQILNKGTENQNNKEGVYYVFKLLNAYPVDSIKNHSDRIIRFADTCKNINTETYKLKKKILKIIKPNNPA
ncbi:MAG: hypothetical protein K8S16_02000 [Bacteroidales bacterium]|nr:hypothetical protein [Bacteroidales bacterium]